MKQKIVKDPEIQPKSFYGMVSVCRKMHQFFDSLERIARSESSILIRGETGTGKELVAKAVHLLSKRSDKAFNAINCATLTPELVLSELFGHEKGAFTGALNNKKGFFEASDKGTIFFDEIAELPIGIQARLLRVLEEKVVTPVGSLKSASIDVRVISATHKSLRVECAGKRFREDLMYRLRVVPIFLPRLANRIGDIEMLTWRFVTKFNQQALRKVTGIESEAMEALLGYSWPGNVRELRNNIELAFAIGEGENIRISELTPELRGDSPEAEFSAPEIEKAAIKEALKTAGGRKAEAAKLLKMSRSTFWRKMREYRLS